MIREYHVNMGEFKQAVLTGKVRTETLTNPHNDRDFTVYAVSDLEECFNAKNRKPSKMNADRWFDNGDSEGRVYI